MDTGTSHSRPTQQEQELKVLKALPSQSHCCPCPRGRGRTHLTAVPGHASEQGRWHSADRSPPLCGNNLPTGVTGA